MSHHTQGLRRATGKRLGFRKAAQRRIDEGEPCDVPNCMEPARLVVEVFGPPYATAVCERHGRAVGAK